MKSRQFLPAILVLFVAVSISSRLSALDPAPVRVLFIGKAPDHPHGTHMYMHTSRVLAKCVEKNGGLEKNGGDEKNGTVETIVSNGWPKDPKALEGVRAIVLYATPGAEFLLDGPGAREFQALVRNGVGVVTLHWASSVFEKNLDRLAKPWGEIFGGYWVSNYGLSTDRSPLTQLVPDHPICRGWKEYELHDEFYLKPVIEKATPLLRVTTKGEDVVVGWSYERPGGGRAYATTLGHYYRNFQIEAFRRMVVNAILWAAKIEVPAGGSDVALSAEELELPPKPPPRNLRDDALVAWCIVPFDGKNRGPVERAEMLRRIGLRRVAYDWRTKHVPTFEVEILEYKKHGIEYFAFWDVHDEAFRLFEKHGLRPQIWRTLGSPPGDTRDARVKAAAEHMLPLVERTRTLGSKLGLYNHGGWGGEPKNLVAVCEYLRKHHDANHVGIVYNQHHGHGHVDDFAAVLDAMKPYLLCLNLNGMTRDGERRGQKILPLGAGELDVQLLDAVKKSGYQGPVGIIGHTQDDVELRLRDNLDGLHWILPQLEGRPAGPKPKYRTHSSPSTDPPSESKRAPPNSTETKGVLLEGRAEFRRPPITVECRATLPDAKGYNILVASDTKRSGAHWELFSMNGTGTLTAYLPGRKPDHVTSDAMICDGVPHTVAMAYEPDRVRLFVDGSLVADRRVERVERAAAPGALAVGRLVEGGLGCRGVIEWVRISRGARSIAGRPNDTGERDAATLLSWRRGDASAHGSQ